MKKLLSLFVAVMITITLWANDITYTATQRLFETTSGDGLHTDAFNVSIASHTFSNGTGTITFDGEVTSIGYEAFRGCSGLTSITIPNTVTSIGGYVFYGCSGLTSVTIPNSVTSIGDGTFRNCTGLTTVTIPNSVTSIGGSAFYGCSNLTSITIPNSVTSIGGEAFHGCSGLTSVTIPNSVTSIGDGAFSGCYGLTSITIPNSVTSIGYEAFRGCSGLTSITIPNSVTSIGDYAFYGCKGLTSVTIPNSVTSIGDGAFYDCSGLMSITIPNSVTSIGDGAFYDCSSLTSITIPNSVTSIGGGAFSGCENLTDIYCYAQVPPTAYTNSTFDKVSQHCYIHIPAGTIRQYQMAPGWSQFLHYIEISQLPEGSPVNQVGVTVVENYATFTWPINPTANSYTLTITKDGEVFCCLTFNSLGQLVGMAFAPARGDAIRSSSAENTAYGFSFVVSGLEDGCTYNFTFTANDEQNNIISTETGAFATDGTTDFESTISNTSTSNAKILRDGVLYILTPNGTFDATGHRVKE